MTSRLRVIRTRRRLHKQVADFLAGLGTSEAEVADRLEREGVQGLAGDTHECALAVYLRAVLASEHEVDRVMVTGEVVELNHDGHDRISVDLPYQLRAFVSLFDKRCFPRLLRAEEPVSGSEPLGSLAQQPGNTSTATARHPDEVRSSTL